MAVALLLLPICATALTALTVDVALFGAAAFATVPGLQGRVIGLAADAPTLAAAAAFNLANTVSAVAGGAVIAGVGVIWTSRCGDHPRRPCSGRDRAGRAGANAERPATGIAHQGSGAPPDAYHLVDAVRYAAVMTTQIAIRLDDRELAALDAEVVEGRAANRSEAVRHAIARLQREQRYRGEEATLVELARLGEPVYPDLDGVLDLPHPALD